MRGVVAVLQVGFPRRAPQRLNLALQHTHRVLWIRCIRRSRLGRVGKLVGFARATSDGALTATIWDVAVSSLPSLLRSNPKNYLRSY
jgi:hypothetical protein